MCCILWLFNTVFLPMMFLIYQPLKLTEMVLDNSDTTILKHSLTDCAPSLHFPRKLFFFFFGGGGGGGGFKAMLSVTHHNNWELKIRNPECLKHHGHIKALSVSLFCKQLLRAFLLLFIIPMYLKLRFFFTNPVSAFLFFCVRRQDMEALTSFLDLCADKPPVCHCC